MNKPELAATVAALRASKLEGEIRAALERGWSLTPAYIDADGKKRPARNGWNTAKRSELRACLSWVRKEGFRMAGVRTGQSSQVVVLDGDVRHGAPKAPPRDWPVTLTARTPGSGWHAYYAIPRGVHIICDNTGKLAPGIDVKGEGGMAILPGSIGAGERSYTWVKGRGPGDMAIAPLPADLLALLRKPQRAKPRPRAAEAETAPDSDPICAAAKRVAQAAHGQQNAVLYTQAQALGRRYGAKGDRATVERALRHAAVVEGHQSEPRFTRTFASGWEAGAAQHKETRPFMKVHRDVLNSAAYKSLSLAERGLLVDLLDEADRQTRGDDETEFVVAYHDERGCCANTFSAYLKKFRRLGFVCRGRHRVGDADRYYLDTRWRDCKPKPEADEREARKRQLVRGTRKQTQAVRLADLRRKQAELSERVRSGEKYEHALKAVRKR